MGEVLSVLKAVIDSPPALVALVVALGGWFTNFIVLARQQKANREGERERIAEIREHERLQNERRIQEDRDRRAQQFTHERLAWQMDVRSRRLDEYTNRIGDLLEKFEEVSDLMQVWTSSLNSQNARAITDAYDLWFGSLDDLYRIHNRAVLEMPSGDMIGKLNDAWGPLGRLAEIIHQAQDSALRGNWAQVCAESPAFLTLRNEVRAAYKDCATQVMVMRNFLSDDFAFGQESETDGNSMGSDEASGESYKAPQ